MDYKKALNGISKRAKFPNNLQHSFNCMIQNEEIIEQHFLLFMPQVIKMSKEFIDES